MSGERCREMTRKEIEQCADEVLAQNCNCVDGKVDVVRIAQNEGFIVGEVDFDDDTDGLILVDTDAEEIMGVGTKKLIAINRKQSYVFKRFIIAHELGHYFLRDKTVDGGKVLIAARDAKHGRNDDENGNDYFAACLLMPSKAFSEKNKELEETVDDSLARAQVIANYFAVPIRSALRRFDEVELTMNA